MSISQLILGDELDHARIYFLRKKWQFQWKMALAWGVINEVFFGGGIKNPAEVAGWET
ncbi:Uncharacterised protein [Cedecea lapagei]|uniref:Uncharacterized protein n=1 Tax=Cedecea lapagei TaxID=158823 RepID=A0A3S4KU19_9ENTR|nr:Uncharacterised protein [Cedecea lapagei]